MPQLYKAMASVVKVAVGPATGNRIARIIRQGGIIPEGVEQAKLDQLEALGLIEQVTIEATPTEEEAAAAEATAKAAAEAEAKAAADAKAAAEAEAKAKATATAKSTPAK
ncbi:hypothetical protein [Arthrobacter sp. Soil762]|uniref:hypothetical protein n=1 Tax=Arthrobacter sp. Soil762 TaxID=1736401 RepID=UPI0006F6974C|nr:hypothetical protein [Arthrobacter sp. Soil762]KRE72589.1 hypothetical protein ASG77_07925 [Arthrobacter sp. Soil762]